MNCKEGDLAYIFKAEGTGPNFEVMKKAIGIPRKLVRYAPTIPPCLASMGWYFDTPIKIGTAEVLGCADSCLRPLRDPGHDEADEISRVRHKEMQ